MSDRGNGILLDYHGDTLAIISLNAPAQIYRPSINDSSIDTTTVYPGIVRIYKLSQERTWIKTFTQYGPLYDVNNNEWANDFHRSSQPYRQYIDLDFSGISLAFRTPYYNSKNGIINIYNLLIQPVITPPVDNTSGLSINFRSSIDGEAAGDRCGFGVSSNANGSIIAIGAYNHDGNKGHVRIYQWNGSSWDQLGTDIDGENAGDESGYAVSLSSDGTIVAIGAIRNADNGYLSGHVRVYQWDGSSWNQMGSDIDGEAGGDESGSMISLNSDGTILAIGAQKNAANGQNSGHLRVFQWDGSSWNQLGTDIDGEAANDYSGRPSLSSDGTIVAIGAHVNDGATGANSGHVRVYKWDGSSWNQVGPDIDGEAAGDQSGRGVSLSSDGTIVAIGAPTNDVIGGGAGGGHVRVYQWDGSAWNQVGDDIDGTADDAWFGICVSLSSDGTILAVGAGYSNGAAGRARLYQWDGSSWNQVGDDINGEAADNLLGSVLALSSDGSLLLATAYNYNNSAGRVYIYETS